MATNEVAERMLVQAYPAALRHLQQLLMDADACHKNIGKRGIFGGDKFKPALDRFACTLGRCMEALVEDGHLQNLDDAEAAIDAVSEAMRRMKLAYSSWPLAFDFWLKYEFSYRDSRGLLPPQ